jgi:predicted ATPase
VATLAIFAGGCSLEAAEVVCQAGGTPGIRVLDQLESLVRKGLAKCEDVEGQARFGTLETIREYASEALEQSGELAAVSDALRGVLHGAGRIDGAAAAQS